jgi:hypothetical protein
MPSVILKIIGHQNNKMFDYKIENDENITLKFIYLSLIKKDIKIEMIKNMKFIYKGNTISNLDKMLTDNDENDEINVFIFTNNQEIKKELYNKVFTNIPQSSLDINNNFPSFNSSSFTVSTKLDNIPIEDDIEEILIPTQYEIQEINNKIVKSFENKDFLNLIKICINNPELLKNAKSYLVNGDILPSIDMDDISIENYIYDDQYQFINNFFEDKLNFTLDEDKIEKIKKIITHFNGHLNLSLRYILSKFYNIEST